MHERRKNAANVIIAAYSSQDACHIVRFSMQTNENKHFFFVSGAQRQNRRSAFRTYKVRPRDFVPQLESHCDWFSLAAGNHLNLKF
jgi:hypothetical protein